MLRRETEIVKSKTKNQEGSIELPWHGQKSGGHPHKSIFHDVLLKHGWFIFNSNPPDGIMARDDIYLKKDKEFGFEISVINYAKNIHQPDLFLCSAGSDYYCTEVKITKVDDAESFLTWLEQQEYAIDGYSKRLCVKGLIGPPKRPFLFQIANDEKQSRGADKRRDRRRSARGPLSP